MKRIVSFLFVLFFIFSIVSCSNKSAVNDSVRNSMPISSGLADKGVSQESKTDSSYGAPPGDTTSANPIPDIKSRKIIQNATVEISVENPDQTMEEINKETEKLKGYVAQSNKKVYTNGTYASMTIKIPAIALKPFIEFLRRLGKAESETISTNEITKEYYDTRARLDNAINQKKQFELILSKAQKITDLLEVQRQIDSVQERIEQFKGQISLWDQLVDLSTVDVSIRQNEIAQTVEKKTYWTLLSWKQLGNEMKKSWIKFANGIGRIFQGILIALPTLLILGLIALLILWIIRKNANIRKKSVSKK